MKLYVLIQWPESQELMEQPWFNECILAQDLEEHENVGYFAYFVPLQRYKEYELSTKTQPE